MQQKQPSIFFPRLAALTALLTLGLVVLGAVVRVSDSGLGCADSWPLCEGRIVPPLDNLTAWIEWSHRLTAALIGVLGIGMLWLAWTRYRDENRLVTNMTFVAAGLFALQSMLGAIVVVLELPPTFVTLHLGTAMLLLAALLGVAIVARYQPQARLRNDQVTNLVYATTGLAFLIILTGALVRGSGATLACTTWPFCNGQVLPTGQGQLAMIHTFHRVAVLGLGLALGLLSWVVSRNREDRVSRLLSVGALVVYLLQAGVGAVFVLSSARPIWGAVHVGLAATTWGLLVAFSVIERLNSREAADRQTEQQWQPGSELISN
ncbi:MAG: heme A synthase [Chloroflexi bacterium]|nr:MAG: hypothetical protein CUN54_02510 [Phototrophicales bacterium]RMF78416.1 MAG: heme A synthase [Chloroflexota bacterium]